MRSRKVQALGACFIFFAVAKVYELLTRHAVDNWRVLFWGVVGIGVYIGLSRAFGFDPHRTKLGPSASALMHYVDRWELRLGQSTLAMLGCIVVAARMIDPDHFVTAVVSGTLSAWTYFALRLYANGYQPAARARSR
jgi:uncharacterized membrane protein HdeD (DUF308 family)